MDLSDEPWTLALGGIRYLLRMVQDLSSGKKNEST
jgi:hypothetical protein